MVLAAVAGVLPCDHFLSRPLFRFIAESRLREIVTASALLLVVGTKSYYNDASRPELLTAAGIEKAKVFLVAIDDRDRAVAMVEHVRRRYPQVKILARAFLARAREHREILKDIMEADRLQLHDRTERGWTPAPREYTKDLGS